MYDLNFNEQLAEKSESKQNNYPLCYFEQTLAIYKTGIVLAQPAGPVEYTNSLSAEGYDVKQSDGEVRVMLELRGNTITPRSNLARVVASDRILSMNQIEPKCVRMINWIV